MRLHVTGATGFLGAELCRLDPSATCERVDVRDGAAVLALFGRVRPDVVIHTAYVQDGPDARAVTVDGADHVARACSEVGARLIHLSTDVVFDGRAGRAYVERDEPCPMTDYGRLKAEAETLVLKACRSALVVRTSLIVGGPERQRSKHELLAADPEATFYDDEIRSVIQVTDLARALLELAVLDVVGLLHVAGADAVSRAELAELVVGRPVRRKAAPPGRPLNCSLDSAPARSLVRTPLRGARTVFA